MLHTGPLKKKEEEEKNGLTTSLVRYDKGFWCKKRQANLKTLIFCLLQSGNEANDFGSQHIVTGEDDSGDCIAAESCISTNSSS